jgi:hypothetical protein
MKNRGTAPCSLEDYLGGKCIMEKLVSIVNSPFTSNLEVIDKIVMKLHVPYSENDVTIQFNPNIQYYKEQQDTPDVQVRQIMLTKPTDQTKIVKFDFSNDNIKKIDISDTTYTIKLMSISRKNMQGQGFPVFEFFVTWD